MSIQHWQAREFLTYEHDGVIQAPLVADVFLIDVLAEMLSSPLHFLSYLHRRVNYAERILAVNEQAVLGYHLSQNLWLADEMNMAMMPEEWAMHLDAAMTVRRERVPGCRTPPGILSHLQGTIVGRILETIEHRSDPALIDLGFALLTLSSDALDDLNRGLREIAQKTRLDGKLHDLTLAIDGGDTGLTIHCSKQPHELAATMLEDHCRRRKYVYRAGSWFGLAVRADDGLPKFGINLRFPWERDPELDEATKGMVQRSAQAAPKAMLAARPPGTAKIGRNEPCPCGSGRKYKKCCLK